MEKLHLSTYIAAALLLLLAVTGGASGMSCSDAVNAMIPCGTYLVGAGLAEPSEDCCRSARALTAMASTVTSRRALCECFKQTGPSFGVNPDRAKRLPPFCKVHLDVTISASVDCNMIH